MAGGEDGVLQTSGSAAELGHLGGREVEGRRRLVEVRWGDWEGRGAAGPSCSSSRNRHGRGGLCHRPAPLPRAAAERGRSHRRRSHVPGCARVPTGAGTGAASSMGRRAAGEEGRSIVAVG